ncbi:MAG: HAMP domain-containing sensor histidine kinase [Myxococcota bacterium]
MGSSRSIFLLDGDEGSRRLLAAALRSSGLRVQEAGDPLGLGDAMADPRWAAVVWDPASTPWLALALGLRGLRERAPKARIFVLADGPEAVAAARAGADSIVPKSLETFGALIDMIAGGDPQASFVPRAPSKFGSSSLAEIRPDRGPGDQEEPSPTRVERTPAPASGPPSPTLVAEPAMDKAALVHDLKEPLRTIRLLLERCDRRFRDDLPQEARALIQWAQRSAEQLSIDLDVLEQGGAPTSSTDVNEVLSEALRNLEALLEDSGGRVTHDVLPPVRASRSVVRRIFENLLGNALRYPGATGPEVHVAAQVLRGEGLFSVRDNGPGIPDSLRRTIFEPGVKGDTGGTGMGLHLVRTLVARAGGEVWFDTVVGQGTTFFFTLPLAERGGEAERA